MFDLLHDPNVPQYLPSFSKNIQNLKKIQKIPNLRNLHQNIRDTNFNFSNVSNFSDPSPPSVVVDQASLSPSSPSPSSPFKTSDSASVRERNKRVVNKKVYTNKKSENKVKIMNSLENNNNNNNLKGLSKVGKTQVMSAAGDGNDEKTNPVLSGIVLPSFKSINSKLAINRIYHNYSKNNSNDLSYDERSACSMIGGVATNLNNLNSPNSPNNPYNRDVRPNSAAG